MQPFDCPEKICLFECANGWTGYIENRDRTETGRITIIARFISDTKESIAVEAWPKSNGNKTVNGWGGDTIFSWSKFNPKYFFFRSR